MYIFDHLVIPDTCHPSLAPSSELPFSNCWLPLCSVFTATFSFVQTYTRSSAIAEGPRDTSCRLKSCQLPRSSAETTCTTSPEPSIRCRSLTRATESCCRQSLTICAINYSGRASELGGIIDLVD